MERPTLHAAVRDTKTAADNVRAQGLVPAVIYGGDRKESTSLSLNHSELLKVGRAASESTLIDVTIDGKTVPALLGEIQRDPLTEHLIHVDLRQLDLTKPVEANIELVFTGESPAVKALGGNLVLVMDAIEVRALPAALVDFIEVSLNGLDTLESAIHVNDIKLPDGVELLEDPHAAVAVIRQQKEETIDQPAAPAADAAAVPTVAEEERKAKEQKEAEEAKAEKA